jgi:hypothetical protein
VRVAFLDEAGISNENEEPFTVVAGPIVHGDHDWFPLEEKLHAIVKREFPDDPAAFLHTADIYGGNKRFHKTKGWDATRRFELLDEIAQIPSNMDLPIVYGFYPRAVARQRIAEGDPGMVQDPTQLAHMMAAARCLMQIEKCMRVLSPPEICSITMENTPRSRKLLKETQQFFRNPPPDYIDDSNKGWLPLSCIRGTPQFEDKADASLLQMADFCAFVIKRQLMRAPKIERFFGPLRKHLTNGYVAEGSSHPLYDPWNPLPERQF